MAGALDPRVWEAARLIAPEYCGDDDASALFEALLEREFPTNVIVVDFARKPDAQA